MNINYFMSLAYKEAEKGYLLNEVPVGAILIDNATNSVISSAYNQVIKQKNSTKHAEMLLIEKGCKEKNSKYLFNTSIATFLITRITLETSTRCVSIDRIYFGAYDEKKGSLESIMKIYNNKNYYVPEVYGGINEIESSKILKKFFQEKRR